MCTKRICKSKILASLFIIWALFVSVSALVATAYDIPERVLLGGFPFGSRIRTKGVLVVDVKDVDSINGVVSPAKTAGIESGDVIVKVNSNPVDTCSGVSRVIAESGGKEVELELLRGDKTLVVKIIPVLSRDGKSYKSGLWIRDGAAGIGTVTYVIPDTLVFAGLGHGICDSDSGKLVPFESGKVFSVNVFGVVKSEKGSAGELKGQIQDGETGHLTANTPTGVYGKFNSLERELKAVGVAKKEEVAVGDCKIYTTLAENTSVEASAKITKIIDPTGLTKNFVIEITDKALLEKTGGIVQGMSGSPIIQNGKLIGAVTHVFVNDPTRGYGIFIENMLAEAEKIK